jgi:hypothetical protein
MAGRSLAGVLRYVRGLADANAHDHSDGDLLQRFIASRDEGAFAVLLQRHGPLVLGVCRHVLGTEQDCRSCSATSVARRTPKPLVSSVGRPAP